MIPTIQRILILAILASPAAASVSTAAPPNDSAPSEAANPTPRSSQGPLTSVQQLRHEVRTALRSQATAGDQEQAAAVARLLRLRHQVASSEKLSPRMRKQLATKLHNRLARLRGVVARDLRKRQQRVADVERRAQGHNAPEKLASIQADKAILAQWQDVLGQFGDADGQEGGLDGGTDGGEQLVELIEQTICPDTWEVNGGTGRIVYFGNLQALVVSATGQ